MTHRVFVVVLAVSVLLGGGAGCSREEQPSGQAVKQMAPKPDAPAPQKAAVEEKKPAPVLGPLYDPTGRRDPFVSFIKTDTEKLKVDFAALPPLQRYELGELKYVGVIWEKRGPRALVEDAEGKGYSVRVGTRIGRNDGVVTRITDSEITVKEEVSGYRGKKVSRQSTLQLTTAGGIK